MPPLSEFFLAINKFAVSTPWLHSAMSGYATYGILAIAVLVAIGWWTARARSDVAMATALLVPFAAVFAIAAQQVVVGLVGEARPYDVYPQILVLVNRTSDGSFPSDHACVAGAVAAGLFLVDRRLGIAAGAAAVLMGASRVYVGAHWVLDVIAGLALGATLSIAVTLILRRPVAGLVASLRLTWLRPALARDRP